MKQLRMKGASPSRAARRSSSSISATSALSAWKNASTPSVGLDELLQLLDKVDARRITCGHVVRLCFCIRAQLLGGGSRPTGEQLGELVEVDGGQIDAASRFVALYYRRSNRHAFDLLIQQESVSNTKIRSVRP